MRGRSSISRWAAALLATSLAAAVGAAAADLDSFESPLELYLAGEPLRAIPGLRQYAQTATTADEREIAQYFAGSSLADASLNLDAVDTLNRLLLEHPSGALSGLALRRLARLYFDLGEHPAVVALTVGREPEALPSEVLYLAGQASYILERSEDARRLLLALRPSDPLHAFARFTLGQLAFQRDEHAEALAHFLAVSQRTGAPRALEDRAAQAIGRVRYRMGRPAEAVLAYESIEADSRVYASTQIDLAIAADAAGQPDRVRRALLDAIRSARDDRTRAEARVVYGKLFLRNAEVAIARGSFETALEEIGRESRRAREVLADGARFDAAIDEVLEFADLARGQSEARRRNDELAALQARRPGFDAERWRRPPTPPGSFRAKSPLFDTLRRGLRESRVLGEFLRLARESRSLRERADRLRSALAPRVLRAAKDARRRSRPLFAARPAAPAEIREATIWLALAELDLGQRRLDSLLLNERIDIEAARGLRSEALRTAVGDLQWLVLNDRRRPEAAELESRFAEARARLETGDVPATFSHRRAAGLRSEWETDRRSARYALETLDLKERQIQSAVAGAPLRARTLSFGVVRGSIDWLRALERLMSKYASWGSGNRGERDPAAEDRELLDLLDALLERLDDGVRSVREVLHTETRRIAAKRHLRDELVVAQAEDGIADTHHAQLEKQR